jgi:RNA recognition motif-containing protein
MPLHSGAVCRVFVGGMPFSYEEQDIREYWGYCGEIESLDVMRFPDTGRFKGIAFITFATEEVRARALPGCRQTWPCFQTRTFLLLPATLA